MPPQKHDDIDGSVVYECHKFKEYLRLIIAQKKLSIPCSHLIDNSKMLSQIFQSWNTVWHYQQWIMKQKKLF